MATNRLTLMILICWPAFGVSANAQGRPRRPPVERRARPTHYAMMAQLANKGVKPGAVFLVREAEVAKKLNITPEEQRKVQMLLKEIPPITQFIEGFRELDQDELVAAMERATAQRQKLVLEKETEARKILGKKRWQNLNQLLARRLLNSPRPIHVGALIDELTPEEKAELNKAMKQAERKISTEVEELRIKRYAEAMEGVIGKKKVKDLLGVNEDFKIEKDG